MLFEQTASKHADHVSVFLDYALVENERFCCVVSSYMAYDRVSAMPCSSSVLQHQFTQCLSPLHRSANESLGKQRGNNPPLPHR